LKDFQTYKNARILLTSFCIILIVISCSQDGNNFDGLTEHKSYYENGSLKSVYYLDSNAQLQNNIVTFDSNGNIEQTASMRNDQPHGTTINYRPNGNLESQKRYVHGERNGVSKYYDENGKMIMRTEHVIVEGKSYLNRKWYYDGPDLLVKGKGAYFEMECESDTINVGDTVLLLIDVIEKTMDGNLTFYEGSFDENFEVFGDSIVTYQTDSESYYITQVIGITTGSKFVRGIIHEWLMADTVDSSMTYRNMYFEKEIYVVGDE